MTDQQLLLIALLSDTGSTGTDVEHMQLLALRAGVDLVGTTPARSQ